MTVLFLQVANIQKFKNKNSKQVMLGKLLIIFLFSKANEMGSERIRKRTGTREKI